MIQSFIALGSNIGNRQSYFDEAISFFKNHDSVIHLRSSSFINTVAETDDVQDDYLNAVISFQTSLTNRDLFSLCLDIEKKCGRKTKGDYAPRTIDLDILFFGEDIINSVDLVIPHPRLHLRTFVLQPMLELAPSFVHPVLNKSIRQLYDLCYEKEH